MTTERQIKRYDLLPCPFCGVVPIEHDDPECGKYYEHTCVGSGPIYKHEFYAYLETAVSSWNRRTPADHIAATAELVRENERLREALGDCVVMLEQHGYGLYCSIAADHGRKALLASHSPAAREKT